MLHKRLYQFVLVYFIGLAFLFAVKGIFNLSDYVIPGLPDLYITVRRVFTRYFFDVLNRRSCLAEILALYHLHESRNL